MQTLDAGKVGTQSTCQMRGDTVDRHCEITLIQTKEILDSFCGLMWTDTVLIFLV
jgi:hypothetical protein